MKIIKKLYFLSILLLSVLLIESCSQSPRREKKDSELSPSVVEYCELIDKLREAITHGNNPVECQRLNYLMSTSFDNDSTYLTLNDKKKLSSELTGLAEILLDSLYSVGGEENRADRFVAESKVRSRIDKAVSRSSTLGQLVENIENIERQDE